VLSFSASHGLVEEQRFAYILNLGYRTLEVEGLGEHNLEDLGRVSAEAGEVNLGETYLLHVDTMAGARKDQRCPHGLGESSCLGMLTYRRC
jgi:hypothetical protein